ncbi:hypothetical protein ACS5PN_26600 [Roseateles sp. NT4]|uniref:hypothetical protein n=1 Tax=Roseateles sp. NT4 TaxID=3453715 RepID=UPI003EE895D8
MAHLKSTAPQLCLLLPLAAVLCLEGCGGGAKEDAGSGESVGALSENNYGDFGVSFARAVLSGMASPGVGAPVASLASALEAAGGETQPDVRIASTRTTVTSCTSGGSVTVANNDADGNGTLSAGDVITTTFDHCKWTSAQVAINGALSLQFTSVGSNGASTAEGNFTSFNASGRILNGPFTMTSSQSGSTAVTIDRFKGVTVTTGNDVVTMNTTTRIETTAGKAVVSVAGDLVIRGTTFTVTQATPFTGGSSVSPPQGGSAKLTESTGKTLVMEARVGYAAFSYTPKGATTPTASSSVPWSQI